MTDHRLPILEVHTPSSSFAIVYSSKNCPGVHKALRHLTGLLDTEDTLDSIYDKLTRKLANERRGRVVGPGWVKYSWNDSTWNLDDGTSPIERHSSQASYMICRVGLHDLRLETEVRRSWKRHASLFARTRPLAARTTAACVSESFLLPISP